MTSIIKYAWHIIAAIFFVTIVICGVIFLADGGYFARPVGVADFFLMMLAVWRLVRLFTYDAITQFMREWWHDKAPETLGGTLHTLLTCPWCTGLWFSMMVVFAFFFTPYVWPVLLILAISVLASFLQVLSNLLAWSVDVKKQQAGHSGSTTHTCGG